ncbi:YncE family protein, partial [Pseudomonas syringae]
MQKKASQNVRALTHIADPVGSGVPLDIAWLTDINPLVFVPAQIAISTDQTPLYVAHNSGCEGSVLEIARPSVQGTIKR